MELTKQQIDALEGMIERRIDGAGETREEACAHILNYLQKRFINEPIDKSSE